MLILELNKTPRGKTKLAILSSLQLVRILLHLEKVMTGREQISVVNHESAMYCGSLEYVSRKIIIFHAKYHYNFTLDLQIFFSKFLFGLCFCVRLPQALKGRMLALETIQGKYSFGFFLTDGTLLDN